MRLALLLLLLAAMVALMLALRKGDDRSKLNYRVQYEPPKAWVKLKNPPNMIFVYGNPKTGARLTGATSRMLTTESVESPDASALCNIQVTNAKAQPGVSAWREPDYTAPAGRFALFRKVTGYKTSITAFLTKGYTTAVFTLVAPGRLVAGDERSFRGLLAGIRLMRLR